MSFTSRRAFLAGASASVAALAGCGEVPVVPGPEPRYGPGADPSFGGGGHESQFAGVYGPVPGERFPVPAAPLSRINPAFLRARVAYSRGEPPGTIVIDPRSRYLYHVQEGGRAMRYGVGVGREGFAWSGVATINDKQEWPDWYPPKEMIARQRDLRSQLSELRSGIGVPGGTRNPLGARAMYLWQNGKDTLYRIHGTLEPWTIGSNVSSGCIRMINQDVIDLYARTPVGTKVVVLG
jgi:lipoprotein-anchoring transpeptidase ErfK/SrfK